MAYSEHIYTPKDNSLESRIGAYHIVRDAYRNAEAGLKYLDDDLWSDRLGGEESTKKAFEVSARSLKMATEAVDQKELQAAMAHGWLDADEAREFMQLKRKVEMQSIREGQKSSHSQKDSQRRQ